MAIEALIALHQKLGDPRKAAAGKRLLTEQYHPVTVGLSDLAQNNLPQALAVLKTVDLEMLSNLNAHVQAIRKLGLLVKQTLQSGHKIFISGCGAAGRAGVLALREFAQAHPELKKHVIAILAGGDIALVRSVEGVEDDAVVGQAELEKAGWTPQDLLICLSASGSARFLHGQLEKAAQAGGQSPYFQVCNPVVEVQAKFNYPHVHYFATPVGPMALAGSTRMQAASVQMLIMGIVLLQLDPEKIIKSLHTLLRKTDLTSLVALIEQEAAILQKQEGVYWEVSPSLALTVFTDKTELSPTFTLPYIEAGSDLKDPAQLSQMRVIVKGTKETAQAWQKILGHAPKEGLLDYDLSAGIRDKRKVYLHNMPHHTITAELKDHHFVLKFEKQIQAEFNLEELATLPPAMASLLEQVFIKMLLNNASTLVAGRLNRYYSNLMTYVSPANVKLVDRVIGLVSDLLQQESDAARALKQKDAEAFAHLIQDTCYEMMKKNVSPIVLKTKEAVLAKLSI